MKNKTKTRPHESAIIENNFHHANNKIFSHFTIEFCSSNIKLFFTTPFIKRQQVDITIISLIILWTIQCIVYTQRNRILKKTAVPLWQWAPKPNELRILLHIFWTGLYNFENPFHHVFFIMECCIRCILEALFYTVTLDEHTLMTFFLHWSSKQGTACLSFKWYNI